MRTLVGRQQEQAILGRVLQSNQAEFLAVYGRRRVGKTHLVRQYCQGRGRYLEITGEKDAGLKQQLANFLHAVDRVFTPKLPLATPNSWREAFQVLTVLMDSVPGEENIILFFDELPWLAGRRSGLVQALDFYWNTAWSQSPRLKLIVCGSSASWILDKLIHAKGGLHNRLTETIHLRPFQLNETAEYLAAQGLKMNQQQVLDIYMAVGGIPYYLNRLQKGKSAVQNINDLCFQKDAPLFTEFDRLFQALFDRSEVHTGIIRALAGKRNGMTRNELLRKTGLESGGTVNKRLYELEASGFIEIVTPFGNAKKDALIKVVDEYTLFYLHWIDPIRNKKLAGPNNQYWASKSKEAGYAIWKGYAFEAVCMKHISQIIRALGLQAVAGEISSWRYLPKQGSAREQGAQIDLLIDRSDDAITLCEIKYHSRAFKIDKNYARQLAGKLDVFETRTKTRKQLFLCLVSVFGLQASIWSEDLISNEVTLADLFGPAGA